MQTLLPQFVLLHCLLWSFIAALAIYPCFLTHNIPPKKDMHLILGKENEDFSSHGWIQTARDLDLMTESWPVLLKQKFVLELFTATGELAAAAVYSAKSYFQFYSNY